MTTPNQPADLIGTWHLLNGSKYAGEWTIVRIEPLSIGEFESPWVRIWADDRRMWNVRLEDCFATELEARDAGRARRAEQTAKRQARQPRGLYGDGATMAMLMGISTAGTGRKASR